MLNKNAAQRLMGALRMLRIRVAMSESKLKALREQARLTKRRRKEAKRVAQKARKQFKRSKAEVAELRQALANAEAKLFRAGGRALARKMAKLGPITNRGARSSRKPPAGTRKSRAVVSAASPGPGRLTPGKSASNRLLSSRRAALGGRALTSDQSATQSTDAKAL